MASIQYILETNTKGGNLMQAYCLKCRKKKEMKNPKPIKMKNKRPATQGYLSYLRDEDVQDRQSLRPNECNFLEAGHLI